ncbi:MAG: hypothetical protein J1E62_04040 [Lachnospiraceae bacterium]|nr:hypothetical protein [Lachnospiraceae bacterium]
MSEEKEISLECYLGDLNDYLGTDNYYCREERQFAVFLYNYFYERKKAGAFEEDTVVNYCLNIEDEAKVKILDVYFETTFMRDYFYNADDKKRFNKELLKFCTGWMGEKCKEEKYEEYKEGKWVNKFLKETKLGESPYYNLGQSVAKNKINIFFSSLGSIHDRLKNNGEFSKDEQKKIQEKVCIDIARMMMNATPDIVVVYEVDGHAYVKALECKYTSEEGKYKDVAGSEYPMQLFIQECVMSFCFGKRKKSDGSKDDDKDGIEGNLPKCPTKGIWGDKKENNNRWKEICYSVYKGILTQTREPKENGIINTGVEMITFCKKNSPEVKCGVKIETYNGRLMRLRRRDKKDICIKCPHAATVAPDEYRKH